nr:hypothetical protein [Tanacetum cinerariifolium]
MVGYSVNSKAFRVFNSRTKIVQETLHINFLENKPNVSGIRPKWLFDTDTLTKSMNYQPVVVGNQPNDNAGIKQNLDTGKVKEFSSNITNRVNVVSAPVTATRPNSTNSTNSFNTASPFVNAVSPNFGIAGKSSFVDPSKYPDDPDIHELEDIVYSDDEEDLGAEADLSNLETNIPVSPIPTTRVQKDYAINQIIGDLNSAPQTRRFEDPDYPDKVYKVVKVLYGLHQAPRACQDKYVAKKLRKFGFIDVKLASTPIETKKPLLKNPNGEDVDVHIYKSMIGSLMYLTSSRPDIMFAVCACA